MSIASEITRITDNVANAYTAASAKGATMPVTQNSDNLASTISTISSGGVDTKAWIPRNIDANGKVLMPTTVIDLGGATDLAPYVFYRANYENSRLTVNGVNFSSLTKISGQYACYETFRSCSFMTGKVNLSSLTEISGIYACQYMFYGCSGLTSADLGNLWRVGEIYGCYGMFQNCSNITTVDISKLTQINNNYGCAYMFSSCSALTSIDVSSLTNIYGESGCIEMFAGTGLQSVTFTNLEFVTSSGLSRAFANCQSLTSLYFPKLVTLSGTYCMTGMLSGVTGCTVHFLKSKEQEFSTFDYVAAGFGGTNTTVLFDLGVITATINAPLGSKIYVGSTEVIDPTQTTYSFSAGDGETVTISCLSSTGQYYTEQVTFTQANPSYTVDFTALTYNQIDLSSNVSGVLYKLVNQNILNLIIEIQSNTIYVPSGISLYVFGSVAGYTCDNAVLATAGTTSSVALSFTATTADLVFDCFNFAETLTPSITDAEISNTYILDYTNNVLRVGVQHLNNRSLSKYVSINIPANATKITINYSAYAQGENNYDYGYILFGDATATPSTNDVKNQTGLPSGTEYIFTQTSPSSTMQTYTFEKAVTGGTTKLLTFGFAQDANTWGGDNSTHVGRVFVSFE